VAQRVRTGKTTTQKASNVAPPTTETRKEPSAKKDENGGVSKRK
jgi:hypothetical protein